MEDFSEVLWEELLWKRNLLGKFCIFVVSDINDYIRFLWGQLFYNEGVGSQL